MINRGKFDNIGTSFHNECYEIFHQIGKLLHECLMPMFVSFVVVHVLIVTVFSSPLLIFEIEAKLF